jgi:hypothetical protein
MCETGLNDLAAAIGWASAQDQGTLIGANPAYLTPFYGAVGIGNYPPFSLSGVVTAGSSVVTGMNLGPYTFNGTLVAGTNVVTVASGSTTGIQVGMDFSDIAGNIPSNAVVGSVLAGSLTMIDTGGNPVLAPSTVSTSFAVTCQYAIPTGMVVQGTGIPAYTTVALAPTSSTITLSAPATTGNYFSVPGTLTTNSTTVNALLGPIAMTGTLTATSPSVSSVTISTTGTSTTGNVTSTSATITNLASTSGIFYGMTVSGSGILSGSTVVSVVSNSIIISSPAIGSSTGTTLTFTYNTNCVVGMTVTGTGIPTGTTIISASATTLTLSASATASGSTSISASFPVVAGQGIEDVATAIPAGTLVNSVGTNSFVLSAAPTLSGSEFLNIYNSETLLIGTSQTDTLLSYELGRVELSGFAATQDDEINGSSTLWQFQFPANATNYTITEAGVFCLSSSNVSVNPGDMLDHALISPALTWVAGDTLTLAAQIFWNNP